MNSRTSIDSIIYRSNLDYDDADLSIAIALEAERLANKYNKDVFGCDDLIQILGVGRNNVRELMRSNDFPTICIGGRKVVSAIALAKWMMLEY